MAEERVNYKIEFDQADLAQKLEEVKNQIDLTLSSANFGSAMNSASTFTGGMAAPGFYDAIPSAPPEGVAPAADFGAQLDGGF